MISELSSYERALVTINPRSSHANRVRRQLGKLSLPQHYVLTEADPQRTRDTLSRAYRPGDLILVGGGDGTANQIGSLALSDEGRAKGFDTVPIIFMRGGNANDGATMLNGRLTASEIIKQARPCTLRPLETHIQDGDAESLRHALWYFSVGSTARAASKFETLKNTANRVTRRSGFQFGREILTAWHTVGDRRTYKIQTDDSALIEVSDKLYTNGNRIAKVGRPHSSLAEPEFEHFQSGERGLANALAGMLRLQRGSLYGQMASADTFHITTRDGRPVEGQWDGEVTPINNGSTVSVTISDRSYTSATIY